MTNLNLSFTLQCQQCYFAWWSQILCFSEATSKVYSLGGVNSSLQAQSSYLWPQKSSQAWFEKFSHTVTSFGFNVILWPIVFIMHTTHGCHFFSSLCWWSFIEKKWLWLHFWGESSLHGHFFKEEEAKIFFYWFFLSPKHDGAISKKKCVELTS